jgi:hypothetical protein
MDTDQEAVGDDGRPWPPGSTVSVHQVRRANALVMVVFQAAVGEQPIFVRGEGTTRTEAEAAAWAQYEQHVAPDHDHQFRTVPYSLQDAVCAVCGVFEMDFMEPRRGADATPPAHP